MAALEIARNPPGESSSSAAGRANRSQPAVKQNPMLRFLRWVCSFAIPGVGLFMEAFFIFSVGNLKPIWEAQYPDCWQVTFALQFPTDRYVQADVPYSISVNQQISRTYNMKPSGTAHCPSSLPLRQYGLKITHRATPQ